MADDFVPDEKVVCISDRCPVCKIPMVGPQIPVVGDVYTVDIIATTQSGCQNQPMRLFKPKGIDVPPIWPQDCFKRIPPQRTIRNKNISEPVLEKS